MNTYEESLMACLRGLVTGHKQALIEKILAQRTRWVTVVLEDIHQSQNISAAIRTCECYGVQDVHIVERNTPFATNRQVLKGAHKWMTLHRYKERQGGSISQCLHQLKAQGYAIVTTVPDANAQPYRQFPVRGKVALVVGNELEGVSGEAMRLSDERITIPMFGFTESFNLSATIAILLSHFVPALRETGLPWSLEDAEKMQLRLQWYSKSVRKSEAFERDFRNRFNRLSAGG